MMYNNKLVASIKANGRILREHKETVLIPFGSEYSILLKNLNTVRAVVNIFVDGDNIVPGGLVLNAGQEIDLERSIKNNNLSEGNRFKFIERTAAVENGPRGVKLEDGLIRIEFQFEKPHVPMSALSSWQRDRMWKDMKLDSGWGGAMGSVGPLYNVGGQLRSVDYTKGMATNAAATQQVNQYCADNNITSCSYGAVHDGMATMDWMEAPTPQNDVGITVPGSRSDQSFVTVTMGALETEKHVMVLKILGETEDNKPVVKPVTVKATPKCVTCGKLNKATAKFCSECGTALEIFA